MLKLGQENDFNEFFKEVKNNDSIKYIFELMTGFCTDTFYLHCSCRNLSL